MYSLSISCSNTKSINNTSNVNYGKKQSNIMFNSLYMLNLSHQKMKAIAALDVQIYKAFEKTYKNDDDLVMNLNDICDTIEMIHDINKKNNLYKLFDDKLIPVD